MASSGSETPSKEPAPAAKKPKRKLGRVLGVVVVLVVLIVVFAVILNGSGSSAPKPTFAIISHSVTVESYTNHSFNVTIAFVVNNTGTVTGNVTVIFKAISGRYTWAGAQIFNNIAPGQVFSSYKKHIPVEGDVNGTWVYECYINGQKAVKYPHP